MCIVTRVYRVLECAHDMRTLKCIDESIGCHRLCRMGV